jgi:hypothetical protein
MGFNSGLKGLRVLLMLTTCIGKGTWKCFAGSVVVISRKDVTERLLKKNACIEKKIEPEKNICLFYIMKLLIDSYWKLQVELRKYLIYSRSKFKILFELRKFLSTFTNIIL